jgi:hypothetical protein
MFQIVDQTNLVNFGHREGHRFEFQSLGELKSLKIRIGAGANCQPQLPVNRPHRSLAHAHTIPRTVMRRWPYTTGGHRPTCSPTRHPYLCSVSTSAKKSAISLIALEFAHTTALLRPPLPRHTLLAMASDRWAAFVPPNRAKGSALTSCISCTEFLSGSPTTKAGQPSSPRHHLPRQSHCHQLPSFHPSSAITLRRTARHRNLPASTHSPLATSCPSCHHRPHCRRPPHRRQPSSLGPSTSNWYQLRP